MRGLRTARLPPPPMVWSLKSEREHSPPCSGLRQGAKACRSSSLQLPAAACSSLQPCSPAALQPCRQQQAMLYVRCHVLSIGFVSFVHVLACLA